MIRTAAALMLLTLPAVAQEVSPHAMCEASITAAEKLHRVPDKLMPAISRVESGRLDPATGRVRAWPWTINVEGTGMYFNTKAEAIAAVQNLQAKGPRSIDVGCMQVNLRHHPTAFANLDEAFDPAANARYAGRFLASLHRMTGNWNLAAANYHSADPDRGEDYQRRVFGRVMVSMGATGAGAGAAAKPGKPAGPYAAWPPPGTVFAALPPPTFAFGAFTTPASSVLVTPLAQPRTTRRR